MTVRLIFQYEGQEVRLLSRQRVDMMPPPSDPVTEYEDEQGFWIEVRDKSEGVLHRQVMQDPIRGDVEAFSDEPGMSVERVPVSEARGTFAVLVPDMEAADHLALMGSPAVAGRAREAASELARFPLA